MSLPIILLALPSFLSSPSPPPICFRRHRFVGGDVDGGCDNVNAREAVVVAEASKCRKNPPPARTWMRGRWWWWQTRRNIRKIHLQLAFGREGGGSRGRRVETSEKPTSSLRLDAREVVGLADTSKHRKNPPPARVWTRGRWRQWETHRKV